MKEKELPEDSPNENATNPQKSKPKWDLKRIIATAVSVIVTFLLVIFCMSIVKAWTASSAESEAASEASDSAVDSLAAVTPVKDVKVMKVANESIKSGFSAQGRLRAYDKTDVVAEVQGIMNSLDKRFKIGTRYAKDEVMIDIDHTEAKLALQAQKAQLQTAITAMLPDMKIDMPSSFSNWKAYLDRFDVNQPIRSFPKSLSDRETYYVSTKNLTSQYYNIKSAEFRLGKYQIRAPFDGVLTTANINEGGFVRAGTPLGTLMNTYTFEMEAAVQVKDLKGIKKGSSVKVVSDDSGKSWTGKVKRIGDMVDPVTQTATVYIGLSGNGLREGQYLKAIINASAISQATEIPRSWIVNNDHVYTVANDELKLEKVEVVKIEGENAIVKGIQNGTNLLSEPVKGAHEGMKVKAVVGQ